MYCSKCGNFADDGLKYCKSCGAKLKPDKAINSAKDMLDNILTTLFLVVMFGLGILVGLVAVLLGNGVEPKFVVFISIAYLAAIFGICYTLSAQVPKLIDARLNRPNETPEFLTPDQLSPKTTGQLPEHLKPASVTEHTTRTLDEVMQRK